MLDEVLCKPAVWSKLSSTPVALQVIRVDVQVLRTSRIHVWAKRKGNLRHIVVGLIHLWASTTRLHALHFRRGQRHKNQQQLSTDCRTRLSNLPGAIPAHTQGVCTRFQQIR